MSEHTFKVGQRVFFVPTPPDQLRRRVPLVVLVVSRFVGKGNVFIDSSEHSLGTEFIVVEVVTDAYVVCRKIGTEQYSFLHTENLSDVKDTPQVRSG